MPNLFRIFLIVSALIAICGTHKILVVFPFPNKSHSILGDGVVRHLLEAGHEVTYITTFPWKKTPPKLTQVDVSSTVPYFKANEILNITNLFKKEVPLNNVFFMMSITMEASNRVVAHENVQKLINDPSQHFDAVIAEWLFSDIYSGFAQVYGCPYIMYHSVDMKMVVMSIIDEVASPAYTPSLQIGHLPPFTFMGRVRELFIQLSYLIVRETWLRNAQAPEFEKYFVPTLKKFGRPVHNFREVKNNVSLALMNTHVSMGYAGKVPLNFLSIGGYHIDTDVKPLPEDLQKIMDDAKNGVIYFSMGSNLKSKDIPNKIKAELLEMFGTLKQTVIWKFEEKLENTPKNVKILQWAPQTSILAHPNCAVFITHGGLLSTTETIHFGVPIIGIPMFGDQFINVDQAVLKGFAKRVDLSYNMANELKAAIEDILTNLTYKDKVKELSFIYHHREIPPGKLLVHGVEHVILTKGAPHLRSPSFMTPWHQKFYLDLAAVIIVVIMVVKFIVTKLLKVISGNKKVQQNKKRN